MMGQQRREPDRNVGHRKDQQMTGKDTRGLTRSDSYKQARTCIPSPDSSTNGGSKSTDISLDCSSITTADEERSQSPKNNTKNFFKNIRSQFSFSSLRKKSP